MSVVKKIELIGYDSSIKKLADIFTELNDVGKKDTLDFLIRFANHCIEEKIVKQEPKVKIKNMGGIYHGRGLDVSPGEMVEIPKSVANGLLADFPKDWKVVE